MHKVLSKTKCYRQCVFPGKLSSEHFKELFVQVVVGERETRG